LMVLVLVNCLGVDVDMSIPPLQEGSKCLHISAICRSQLGHLTQPKPTRKRSFAPTRMCLPADVRRAEEWYDTVAITLVHNVEHQESEVAK